MSSPETSTIKRRRLRNPVWNMPVGLQLSLIYAMLVTITLSVLGWALLAQLESFLVQNTADRMERYIQPTLVRTFPQRGGRGDGPFDPRQPGTPQDQAAAYLVRELGNRSDVAVAVLDDKGNILNSTAAMFGDNGITLPELPEGWASLASASDSDPGYQWIFNVPNSARHMAVLIPVTLQASNGTSSVLYLEQVTSLEPADAVLNQVRFYVLLGIVVGTAVGVVAGMLLTRAILRPLDRMVRTAEAIAAGDLDRRLRLPAGRNEVARLGSAFDHMVDRLGAALEAQRRFVADASHELRTPLTSLEGLSEMLLMGADRGDSRVVQRTVRSMHNELGRLGRLVADLLTLSRIDSTAAPVRAVPTDMCRLINEVSEQLGPMSLNSGVRLQARCEGPAVVNGEPDKLKQVVLNLADNALRYTPQGGEVLLLAVHDPQKRQVLVRVQDTGPGIAPEDLPHIFDRFYRGDPSRARATGNSGLGLAIVHAIVQAHGGTITVESAVGTGSRFTIVLPALLNTTPPSPPELPVNTPEHASLESR
jgi:heavy metal sensor kinase